MDKVKMTVIAAVSALMGWMGILAVPVLLMVGCNVIDYFTGLCAAKYRAESVSGKTSIRLYLYMKSDEWNRAYSYISAFSLS